MTSIVECPGNARRLTHASASGVHHALLAELCSALFQTLPRRDQRTKGMEYVYGLLAADGRKSIRNIAALFGDQAAEQRLHHFICSSTWDWVPVRQALARFVAGVVPPRAWVLRPMIIPKAGEHSVGVGRQFFAEIGQVLNAQQAFGVWAASEELRSPVNWRLHLSSAWLGDRDRRVQAEIPDRMISASMGDCGVDAYLELMDSGGLPVRPVLLDTRNLDVRNIVNRMSAVRAPLLARIGGSLRLTVTDPALTGHQADVLPAHHIVRAARRARRLVRWSDGGADPTLHARLAAGVRVRMPRDSQLSPRRDDLLLLATAEIGKPWPAQLWLTNMTAADHAALLRLTTLVDRVDQDFAEIADQVGVRDFAGRSFGGWHRHITLASAAHSVFALVRRDNATASHVS